MFSSEGNCVQKHASADFQTFFQLASIKSAEGAVFFGLEGTQFWHTLNFLIQSNRTCAALFFFSRNYIWRWIFKFFIATEDLKLFCPLLIWINVKWITTISLLQRKLCKQFLLMMETNHFNMVYLNFTLQRQHFDTFLSLTIKYSA